MPAPAPLVRQVRHALAHLYDPDALRAHPVLGLFGLHRHANPQAALRESLLAAIESLKPAPTVPVDSRAWRVYKLLVCRYVQQLGQEQTAHQLGVGVRHVRREQRVAVQALADLVYQKYAEQSTKPAEAHDEAAARLEDELSWLKAAGQAESAAVAETLQAALQLVAPLAAARITRLQTLPLPDLPPVAIHPAALRQAIVSVTTCVIRRVPGGRVHFSAEEQGRQVLLKVVAVAKGRLAAASDDEAASLRAARAILSMDGGSLDGDEKATTLSLMLFLPAAGAVQVLLIDDNVDMAQLFERYVSGTRYRMHCVPSADQLFALLAERRPEIMVLDVMIPGVDGWEILGRLRQHPLTSSLPIIICTIVPERELALALGATGFLPKPVTRQALLVALRQALGEPPPESR